ncbi:MAG TPA: hypothetical protein VHO46_05350 [Bacteroidales bacterium]|nr:hypothetical protein [Bacteroidales bacterium]
MKKAVCFLILGLLCSSVFAQKEKTNNNQSEHKESNKKDSVKKEIIPVISSDGEIKDQNLKISTGSSGVKRSISYRFTLPGEDQNPDAKFWLDNDNVSNASYILAGDRDLSEDDQSNWYSTWDETTGATGRGRITLVESQSGSPLIFDISGVYKHEPGYWKIPVKYVSGSQPVKGLVYYFVFERISHGKQDNVNEVSEKHDSSLIPEQPQHDETIAIERPVEPDPIEQTAEEIKPVGPEPVEVTKPVEQPAPVEEIEPDEQPSVVEETTPIEQPESDEEIKPVELPRPVEEPRLVDQTKPSEQIEAVEQIKPVEQTKPVEEIKPVEQPKPKPAGAIKTVETTRHVVPAKPAAEQKPVIQPNPVERPKPAREAKPPVQENTQSRQPASAQERVSANSPEPAVKPGPSTSRTATVTTQRTKETEASQKSQMPAPQQQTQSLINHSQPSQAPPVTTPDLPSYRNSQGYGYDFSSANRERRKWYCGIIEAGYGLGIGEYGIDNFRINFINGIHIGRTFSAGLGIGVRRYFPDPGDYAEHSLVSGKVQIPVFLDLRKTFSTRKVTPYLALGVGNTSRYEATADTSETIKEGLFFCPSGGIWFNISSRFAVFCGIAYEIQKMEYLLISDNKNYKKNTSSMSLNIGIAF